MKILAINTALKKTSVALITEGKISKEQSWLSQNDEAEKLMPTISKMIKSYDDLDAVAVVKGPGSFTGLRIGITVANTIAYLQKIPVYEIDTFQFLFTAQEAKEQSKSKTPTESFSKTKQPSQTQETQSPSALLLYAGKKEIYLQFKKNGPVVILTIDRIKESLTAAKITHTFGVLLPDQADQFKSFNFKEIKDTLQTIIATTGTKNFKKTKTVTPLYVKGPNISQPKPGLK